MGKPAPQAPAVPNPNAPGALLVNVKDPAGNGIKGCTVRLHRPKTNDNVEQQTDETGSTLFDELPPAPDYGVSITKKGFGTIPAAGQKWFENALSGIASVIPGPDVSDTGGEMRNNKAKLTVKVIDATTNLPLAGASVGVDGTTGTPMPLSNAGGTVGPFEVDADVEIRFHAEKAGMGPAPGGAPMGGVIDDKKTLAFGDDKTFELRLHQAPLITPKIDQAKLVVVVKKLDTNPKRQPIILSCDQDFDGTGTLKATGGGTVKLFSAATAGTEIPFSRTYTGAELKPGFTVFVEGATASTKMDDLTLELVLSGGSKNPTGSAKTLVTVVEATLDICQSRVAAATDPTPMSAADKINVGRFVHKQVGTFHGRAKLIVRQVKPTDFTGTLSLSPRPGAGGVSLFDSTAEVPAAGQAALATPNEFAASTVPAAGLVFFAEGTTNSSALRDTGFRIGIKGVEDDADHVKMTVVEFTKIEATIKSTPANTLGRSPVPADHVFRTTGSDPSYTATLPLVLIRNAQPDIALEVTATPASLPIKWAAVRDAADHASLGGTGDIPTVTPNGAAPTKATLSANNKGSFHVRPYIDCNGNGTYNDLEPSIPLNLVLADVKLVQDKSAGFNGNLTATANAGGVAILNGSFNAGSWAQATAVDGGVNGAGMTMEIDVDVTGGGADGRLGLDKVFGGLVNNLTGNAIQITYVDATAAPPVTLVVSNRYVTNLTSASSAFAGARMFLPTDTAPALLLFPILDSGRPNAGAGGETATMNGSGPTRFDPLPTNIAVGQRRTFRCIDSPGRGFPLRHPVRPAAVISSIHYVQQFRANFCFWTNVTAVRGASGDPADRVYSVLQRMDWAATGDWTVATGGPAPVLTNTNPHQITISNVITTNPINRAQDNGVEVRPPSGITSAIGWQTT